METGDACVRWLTEEGCAPRLVLAGSVTSYHSDDLLVAAIRLTDGDDDVVVACAELDHLSCAAIQILLALGDRLAHAGRSLRLDGVPDALAGFLGQIGLRGPLGLSMPAAGQRS